jgi:hypothetical protein
MTSTRRPSPSADQPSSWRSVVDGWMKDPDIRRHGLIALAMVLAAVLLLAWIVFANGGSLMNHLITATSTATGLSATASKIVGAAVCLSAGTGGLVVAHRRRRAARRSDLGSPTENP